jgi:pyruvate formate lyase activating enzyme
MRCDYCYNSDIVFSKQGKYNTEDAIEFLKKRVNKLDGVVLSGGEATGHYLYQFCEDIKELGFDIKLDTNGTYSRAVKELLDLNLIDYVALDYKAPKSKFTRITKSSRYNEFDKTLDYLINSNIKYEVRTTLHSDLLNENDINEIIKDLDSRGYKYNYYLQEFIDTQKNIGNIKAPIYKFDKTKLVDNLNIVFR